MKSRFITDPHSALDQDALDQGVFGGFPNTAWTEVYVNFSPAVGGNPSGNGPIEISGTPAPTSEAVLSSSAQSGPTSIVAMTSGGIVVNLLFDAAAMAAPASFRAGIQQAASILSAAISDKITVNIKVDYSGTGAATDFQHGSHEIPHHVMQKAIAADAVNEEIPASLWRFSQAEE